MINLHNVIIFMMADSIHHMCLYKTALLPNMHKNNAKLAHCDVCIVHHISFVSFNLFHSKGNMFLQLPYNAWCIIDNALPPFDINAAFFFSACFGFRYCTNLLKYTARVCKNASISTKKQKC